MLVVDDIQRVPGYNRHNPDYAVPDRERVDFVSVDTDFQPGSVDQDIVSITVMAPAGTYQIGDYVPDVVLVDDDE